MPVKTLEAGSSRAVKLFETQKVKTGMKPTTKSMLVSLAIGLGAAAGIGASLENSQRPASVAADSWVQIGERAGLALGSPSSDNRAVDVRLFVKTKEGWRQARV